MLPVQVKVLSSSSCSLSEASALLQRFLSSDACSDSFARDYVANVAQALEDSIFRRAGGLESSRHRHFSASSSLLRACSSNEPGIGKQSSLVAEVSPPVLNSHGKQTLLVAEDHAPSGLGRGVLKQNLLVAGDLVAMETGSAMTDGENAFRRHKKKRRHSAVENGFETVPPSALETEDPALAHHDKKRRRKERHERDTEFIRTEESADDGKYKKKKKQTENLETEDPALDNQKLHDKKKRRRKKQGRVTEDMGARDVTGYGGPLPSLSIDENLGVKSPVKGNKWADAENIGANKASEVGVSFTPLSPSVEEHAGSSKRRRKHEKAGFLVTPDKALLPDKSREERDLEVSPVVEFGSSTSGEKKKKKKKRRKELGELVLSD